jgi:hypothetical protein
MKILDQNSVKLCKQGSCCVQVNKIEENRFEMTDDYDGKVVLTKEEFLMLKEAVEHFSSIV